jgi:hypothetical protein
MSQAFPPQINRSVQAYYPTSSIPDKSHFSDSCDEALSSLDTLTLGSVHGQRGTFWRNFSEEDIVAMNEEAMRIRETFRSDTTALANRGLIDRARLAGFKGLVGYKNVAFELIDCANLMRDCWARIPAQRRRPRTKASRTTSTPMRKS